jgi:hypothetical protein
MLDGGRLSRFGTVGAAFADTAQTATMARAPINFRLVERIEFLPKKPSFITSGGARL